MDETYISHHGIPNMKWGQRRYQNKDGSLTPAGRERYRKGNGKSNKSSKAKQAKKKPTPEETVEQKRARLLKSTDAHELYANKHLLTTNEINERLTRIDTEKRLGSVAAADKRGFAKFMENAQKVAKTADDIYKLTQSDAVKAVMKKLKGEEEPSYNKNDLDSILKNKDKISNKDLEELKKRLSNIDELERMRDKKNQAKKDAEDAKAKAKQDAKAKKDQDDAYDSAKGTKEDTKGTGVKGMKWGKRTSDDEPLTGEIIGEGTSKRKSEDTSSKKSTFETIYMDYEDTPVSSDSFSGFITAGNQVLALLEPPKG